MKISLKKFVGSIREFVLDESMHLFFLIIIFVIVGSILLHFLFIYFFGFNPVALGQFGDWIGGVAGTVISFVNLFLFVTITKFLRRREDERHEDIMHVTINQKTIEIKYAEMVYFKEHIDGALDRFNEVGGIKDENVVKLSNTASSSIQRLYLAFPELKGSELIGPFFNSIADLSLGVFQRDGNEAFRKLSEVNIAYLYIIETLMAKVLGEPKNG